jgi:nucleoside-triphosphatase THEP1
MVERQGMRQVNLAAVVYGPGEGAKADELLCALAGHVKAAGVRPAGATQRAVQRIDRRSCDMLMLDLSTDTECRLSEDRGPSARGCRLNTSVLEDLVGSTEAALSNGANMLIINKFGKQEAHGAGFRETIARAVENDIPTIVGVNRQFLQDWHAFVGQLAEELPPYWDQIENWVLPRLELPASRRDLSSGARNGTNRVDP